MLVDPFYCVFLLLFFALSFLFCPFVMGKDEKICFNAETNDFDQRMAYRAPACWSKYTTVGIGDNLDTWE